MFQLTFFLPNLYFEDFICWVFAESNTRPRDFTSALHYVFIISDNALFGMEFPKIELTSRKHAYIMLTPFNPTFI